MDCLEFLREQPDKSFDLAVVDPPYGGANDLSINGGGRFGERFDRYKNGRDMGDEVRKKIIGWDVAPGEEYFKELFRVSKNQIIWGGNYFSLPPTRCFLVWRKLTISESFTMAMAEYAWTSFNGNAKVFECAPQGASKDQRFHPTQKPSRALHVGFQAVRQAGGQGSGHASRERIVKDSGIRSGPGLHRDRDRQGLFRQVGGAFRARLSRRAGHRRSQGGAGQPVLGWVWA